LNILYPLFNQAKSWCTLGFSDKRDSNMLPLKDRTARRNRGIGLVFVGSSFAIQMIPPILHIWARILGVSDERAMAIISAVYLVLLAVVMVTARPDKS
jgi:hypothetical protein